ncbi:uncharacterized protein LOC135955574 [Calliphora vicina]|uniref:uncharacterized protein LOC135955574 n=1 Tax=Calliphora vicina TaxID=7373 RepID=UPI00325A9152
MGATAQTLQQNVNEFLRQYKNAPHTTTNLPLAQLFLGRQLRTRLDLLRPEHLPIKTTAKQFLKSSPSYRVFDTGYSVYFLPNNKRNASWVRGTILNRIGDLHYEIRFEGRIIKRHLNQIRRGNKNIDDVPTAKNQSEYSNTDLSEDYNTSEGETNAEAKLPVRSSSPSNEHSLPSIEGDEISNNNTLSSNITNKFPNISIYRNSSRRFHHTKSSTTRCYTILYDSTLL